jgi:hypothetical protein
MGSPYSILHPNSIQDGQKILECPEEALFEVQGHN